LYAYHIRDRQGDNWIAGVPVSAALARRRTPLDIARSQAPAEAPPAPAAVRPLPVPPPARRCYYTVITGNYDPPPPAPQQPGWDCILFTDRPEMPAPGWRIVTLTGEGDAARLSRLPKILPHKYLPEYEYSIYVDAHLYLAAPSLNNLGAFVQWAPFAACRHGERHCVYDELVACARIGKVEAAATIKEAERLAAQRVPADLDLFEGGVLLRRHNDPEVVRLQEAWWQEYCAALVPRDQTSLAVALWRTGGRVHPFSRDRRQKWFAQQRLHRRPYPDQRDQLADLPAPLLRPPRRRVIYTAIFGGYDCLREPGCRLPGWDLVALTDDPGLRSRAWRVRVFEPPADGPLAQARWCKTHPHVLFPDHEVSLWVDSAGRIHHDPVKFGKGEGWPAFMMVAHRFRKNLIQEAEQVIATDRALAHRVGEQVGGYQRDGFTRNVLYETGVLLRKHHNPFIRDFDAAWWDEQVAHTFRDQLSLPYLAWKWGLRTCKASVTERSRYIAWHDHVRKEQVLHV
jgi:hypothetical protein